MTFVAEFSWSEGAKRAEAVIGHLEGMGIRVPAASRLQSYASRLRLFADSPGRGDPKNPEDLELLFQASLEVTELWMILDQFASSAQESAVAEKLKVIVKDPLLPSGGGDTTRGRDTQFEMYIASIFKSGGLDVTLGEPDVLLDLNGFRVGLAAKRLKSIKKLKARVRSASGQIVRARVPGIIFLDLELAINPDNAPLVGPDLKTLENETIAWFERFWSQHKEQMVRWIDRHHVFGICLVLRKHTLTATDMVKALHATSWAYIDATSARMSAYQRIVDRFLAGGKGMA